MLYFTRDEYDSASALLKLNKSAGVDLITSEVVQSLGDSAHLTLFNQIKWPLASRLDIEPATVCSILLSLTHDAASGLLQGGKL